MTDRITNREILDAVKESRNTVIARLDEHERTLRGFNGNVGLVATANATQATVSRIEESMKILQNKGCFTTNPSCPEDDKEVIQSEPAGAGKNVTFQWLVEKIFLPVLLPLLSGLITAAIIINTKM